MNHRIVTTLSWFSGGLLMALIFYLSSQVSTESYSFSRGFAQTTANALGRFFPSWDLSYVLSNNIVRKLAHFFVYLVLGILVMIASSNNSFPKTGRAFMASGLCALYAVSDEVHQLFVPGRNGQVQDVLIDTAGAIIGIGIYILMEGAVKRARRDDI